jgi:hypothetical protein
MTLTVNTSGRLYDDFLRLLFLHAQLQARALAGELPSGICWFDLSQIFGNEDL